jgi:hypothetical protein
MIVTFAVFSVPIDRPPDKDVTIEITQQNDFILPVVIDEPILMVSETIYQPKEMPTILTSIENKGDVQKGKAINTHLKKSGTERYINNCVSINSLNPDNKNKESGLPRIRGHDKANLDLLITT